MKKIVIIAGIYYPEPSPTGSCVRQYAEILKHYYDVSVVFIQSNLTKIDEKSIDGIKLYALFNIRLFLEYYFEYHGIKAQFRVIKKGYNLLVLMMKILGRIETYVLWPNNLRWFYKKAFKKIKNINNEKNIDIIFTINSPFSAHLAGLKYKKINRDIRWITFTIDPYSQNINKIKSIFPKIRKIIDQKVESLVYNEADYNLVSEEVYLTDKIIFQKAINKTTILPYLIQQRAFENKSYFDKNKINLIFAGRFYKSIRNPEYLLKTFINIKNADILLHLYSFSNCEEIIDKYIERSNGRIIQHSPVSTMEIKDIMMDADILINVGNTTPAFKPSKTFEYISTGKPIIHFFTNDLIDQTLLKYPITLQLNQKDELLDDNSKRFSEFCIMNKGKILNYEQVSMLYPQHSLNNIKNILYRTFDNKKELITHLTQIR